MSFSWDLGPVDKVVKLWQPYPTAINSVIRSGKILFGKNS